MPKFGTASTQRLETCDPRIQRVLNRVIKFYDFSVLCGHRGEEEQNQAYHSGHSKLVFPQSKHNSMPSLAVDIAPYPIDWEDLNRFFFLAGAVLMAADEMGIPLRWGGDWNQDMNFKNQTFFDYPHFELIEG